MQAIIQRIQGELANIVVEEITIPPKFYNSLIGPGGKLVHSISMECGGVQIKFPSAESKSDKVGFFYLLLGYYFTFCIFGF